MPYCGIVGSEVSNGEIGLMHDSLPECGIQMAERDDDVLTHGTENVLHSWDEEEWQYYLATN